MKRHVHATGDTKFELEVGLELLVATARLWRSLGSHDSAGNFRIDGVTGPDEYSSIADNNVYTNLMAQQNLRYAAEVAAKTAESMPGTVATLRTRFAAAPGAGEMRASVHVRPASVE